MPLAFMFAEPIVTDSNKAGILRLKKLMISNIAARKVEFQISANITAEKS